MEIMNWIEIAKWIFYALFGCMALGIALYFIFSPFALVIGLFNPRAVLDDEKPQTRTRVLKYYGVTTSILAMIGFGAFSSIPAKENIHVTTTYSAPSVVVASAYTPSTQKRAVSEYAAQVRTGMTFEQVTVLLGQPDTVLNDEIREAIGEVPTGDDLHKFYWRNDKPDCFPIAVAFSPISRQVTGIDEGRSCIKGLSQTSTGAPLGESCTGNELCKF